MEMTDYLFILNWLNNCVILQLIAVLQRWILQERFFSLKHIEDNFVGLESRTFWGSEQVIQQISGINGVKNDLIFFTICTMHCGKS